MNGSELKATASDSDAGRVCVTNSRPALLVAVSDMETRCWKILTANKNGVTFIYIYRTLPLLQYFNMVLRTKRVSNDYMFLIIYDYNFLFAFCYFLICVA